MFTPAERRGTTTVVLLLLIGAGWDLWRGWRPTLTKDPDPAHAVVASDSALSPGPAPLDSAARGLAGTIVSAGRIDLNRASATDLDALPGIGPVLARRIIEHRAKNGPFRSLEELRAVRGIGPRLLDRLKPRLTLGPGLDPRDGRGASPGVGP